jgi:hypothetical protein
VDSCVIVENVPARVEQGRFARVRFTRQMGYDTRARYLGPSRQG